MPRPPILVSFQEADAKITALEEAVDEARRRTAGVDRDVVVAYLTAVDNFHGASNAESCAEAWDAVEEARGNVDRNVDRLKP